MSMLNNSSIHNITDSTFVINTKDTSAFEKLKDAAAPSAFHRFVGRPQPARCYPNTRVDVLGALERWAMRLENEDNSPDSSPAASDDGHVDLSMGPGDDNHSDPSGAASDSDSLDSSEVPIGDQHSDSFGSTIGGENLESPISAQSDDNLFSFKPATAYDDEEPWPRKRLKLPNLPIIWLNGGAGAGKSAVAQTFAERCEDLGHIVASFFFFSTDPTRNSANQLVATLAYQIARAEPGARTHIEAVIHRDPHIFNDDFKKQFTSLIIDPIQRHSKAQEPRRPCTIIIDGLDECTEGAVQAGIVNAICEAVRAGRPDPYTRLRFLICSRPEELITRVFHLHDLQGVFTSIDLSKDGNARDDICTFLNGKFDDIKRTHSRVDLIPESWPSWETLSQLADNSSGHFIYAATVMKFVSTDARPVNALEIILGLRASPQRAREPFAELDVLYHHILSRAVNSSSIDNIRHVFGFVSIEDSPASYCDPDVLEKFFDLQEGELDDLFGITASLVAVQRFGENVGVNLHHKSFGDFLHDETRAGRFYIEQETVCAYAWNRCCDMILNARNLEVEICWVIRESILVFSAAYDFVAGTKSYSMRGMTQRQGASGFLKEHPYVEPIRLHSFADRCFEYFWSLIHDLRNSEENDELIYQATGDMISIIKDLLWPGDRVRIPDLYPNIAFSICRPASREEPSGEFARPALNFLILLGQRAELVNSRFALVRNLFEDERMGEYCLDEDHYAEACLFSVARLSNADNFFTPQSVHVVLNQRLLIMNQAARRLRTPFRWRKVTQIICPSRRKGRVYFLHNRQEFHLGRINNIWWLNIGLTRRELHFRSRSNLVRQHGRDELHGSGYPLLGIHALWSGRNAIPYSGRRTTVRGYIMVADRSNRLSFLPFREIKATRFGYNSDARHDEIARRELYASMLSGLPKMFAKASKSDAVAALRFKTFAPLAKRFPKLVERARRAMEEYDIKHGYPAIDGCFGNPLEISSARNVHQGIGIPNTCVCMILIYLQCLYLRLVALFGDLDEIYLLRDNI